jgi:hypothetical protein
VLISSRIQDIVVTVKATVFPQLMAPQQNLEMVSGQVSMTFISLEGKLPSISGETEAAMVVRKQGQSLGLPDRLGILVWTGLAEEFP